MNERIKELAEQARQIGEYVNYGQIRLSPEQFEQKFAELIVQECAEIQNKRSCERHGYDKHEDAQAIKQHFGIEE